MRLGTRELAAELAKRGYQISAAGISRAKKSGRVDPDTDGKYDPDEFVRAMALNTNAVKSKSARAQQSKGTESAEEPAAKKPTETLSEAQTRKEIALANLREKEDREKDGALIDAASVRAAWVEMGSAIRDAVMGLPIRVCNRVPAEWRRELATVLEDEARKVLTALSDDIRSDPRAA